MVGTVEQKLHATGDGTELADYQPLVVDRIMVKYIVPLKKQRIRHKVVVDGIVAHYSLIIFSRTLFY